MDRYRIEGTKSTPFIDLNVEENKFTFIGQSYPENAFNLYEPIYKWMEEYFLLIHEEETTIDFTLSYINTSSTKCLFIFFEKLNLAFKEGKKIIINWNYDIENGFDYDMGCDFKEDIVVPFYFIPKQNAGSTLEFYK